MLKNIRYEKIYPTGGIGNLQNRELTFQYTPDILSAIDQSASYLSVVVRATHREVDTGAWINSALPTSYTLSNNACNNLFARAKYDIKSNTISTLNDYSQVSLMHTLLNNSSQKLANNHSVNPITLYKRWALSNLSIDNAYKLNRDSVGLEDVPINVFSLCADLPLFVGDNVLPGNVQHSFELLVQNTYQDNIFVNRANIANFDGYYINGQAPPIVAGHTYVAIEIVEISLNFLVHEVLTIPRSVKNYRFYDYWSLIKPIASIKETIVVPFPMNAEDVTIFFRPANGATRNLDLNVFSDATIDTSANAKLKRYSLRYGGHNIPSQTHALNFETVSSQPRFDNARLFNEFIDSTKYKVPNGSAFDLTLWASNVIIYHPLPLIPNDKDTNCNVTLEFSSAPINSQMVIMCKVQKDISFDYDKAGTCETVTVNNLKN